MKLSNYYTRVLNLKPSTVQDFKEHLKAMALEIRKYKSQETSAIFRHQHIAYCMERGTPYELIEPKVREHNEPNWDYIVKVRALFVKPQVEVTDESAFVRPGA